MRDKLVCSYCGEEKKEVKLWIGSAGKFSPDWTIHEGTGKTTCPNCYELGATQARIAINKLAERTRR